MGLFEKQYSDEQVVAAREKIAAGTSSLRAAAAEIGCAASTLSNRIKKAEATEADARIRLGIRDRKPSAPTRRGAESERPASGPEGSLTAGGDPVEVLRGALQATKANGQPDWQIRLSAARTLAALPPRSPSPNRSPSPRLSSTTSRRGAARSLHCAPPALFRLATTSELPAEPLPESGLYVFQGEKGLMIPLVRHGADDGDQVHILSSREAAADILRAFGGDPHFLDTISADPQPNTNTP